ncbi:MAG TPA: hypothetical protein VFY73_22675 [Ideonella sp.]|uniref:hypothetical protein n=1 Tax=Ideonella sp. TaxID=1929293 RepID=UPI002E2F3B8B|nr:hypothetical protein [Ideonella sp.]HEX5686824.1 hypothetical protein [Ideonella sp.]
MSETLEAPVRKRTRHARSAAARAHVPARAPQAGRSHGLPSPRRVLSAQVVAWHNRHPLARRINRRQLGGYGVVSLPFSPAPPEGQDGPPRFPMFDDLSLIPGLSRSKVVALALAQGWRERPGAPEWPLRQVPVAKGWDASKSEPIHLLTVALKRGKKKPPLRLLIGRSAEVELGGVIGHRLSSRPRLVLAGLVLMMPLLVVGWGLKQMWPSGRGGGLTLPPVAEAPRQAESSRPEGGSPPRGRVSARPDAPVPLPGNIGPVAAAPTPGPDDILPVPKATDTPGKGPRVGSGLSADSGDPRAATGPDQFRLVGPPLRDATVLQTQATKLQSALEAMGQTGGRLRMDVVGTPEGDALSIGPVGDQAEAERIAKRLAARGITLKVTEQP